MIDGEWEVFGDSQTPDGRASVPEPWRRIAGAGALFVRIQLANSKISVAFPIEDRKGASGNRIYIRPGVLGLGVGARQNCTVEVLSEREYRKYRLFRTRAGQALLVGLVGAILGTLIDTSLKIGAEMTTPWMVISEACNSALLGAAAILQISGLALVFFRTVIAADI